MPSLQEAMIINATQKLLAAQPPRELRNTLHELLVDWFGEIPPTTKNESRYKAAFTQVKDFLEALENVDVVTLKKN